MLVEFGRPIKLFKFLLLEKYLGELLRAKVALLSRKAFKPAIAANVVCEIQFLAEKVDEEMLM